MNLERGFRRLVLTVSLAVAGAGLVVTAYDTYKTIRYVRATNEFVACSEEAEHRTPTAEDFTSLPEEWRPKIVPPEKLDDAERLKSWIEKARDYRQHLCGYILITLPVHLDRAIQLWYETDWLPLWATSPSGQSYSLALLPLFWGIVMSSGFSALPWGVFYLLRWIVHGFRS
jgi:hypothetical protein